MEWLYKKIMLLAVCVLSLTANATDFLNTSFETSDGFTAGKIRKLRLAGRGTHIDNDKIAS